MTPDICVAELEAYLDGELDLIRRFAVEAYLADRPAEAARMMADLRTRTALRLLQRPSREATPATGAAALRLTRRLRARPTRWRRLSRAARIVAPTAAALSMIWLLTPIETEARPPEYVSEAMMAYQTSLLRARMASQPESLVLDIDEILRATRIHIPPLPSGWEVTDVQVFPSEEGPALQIMLRTRTEQSLALFAVRTAHEAPLSPEAIGRGAESVAYWRKDDIAFALVGSGDPVMIDGIAEHFVLGQTS
ncbi:anti-sigma factor [Sphingosinicella sp. LHD-64]|uniref:anti-sigma factor family protein n=1 Tax=Sphingosinicella sp. LHD-64 TaxID=3072139 RepID=UPI00280F9F97|nr:anti-sigma factor [Sphingosinicella sp. LHD-64]MDQ8757542.1 anti-sigma factor [Sphingosinicella sp. LHD-64]